MPGMGLKGSDKTAINTFLSDLDTAINGLDPSDRSQLGVRALLVKFRTQLLEVIRHERTQ